MKTSALTIGIILLARLVKVGTYASTFLARINKQKLLPDLDGRRGTTEISETLELYKTDAKYTALLKEINSTYHGRPHNTANNLEFEKYFQTVLSGLNLTVYDIADKIDIYTDFTVYNQIRLELEREISKTIQVAKNLLSLKNLLPHCRTFFMDQQVQMAASISQSNLMKMEILNNPSPECENVELNQITFLETTTTTTTPKPINYDSIFRDILQKYSKRPWGNLKYLEFDEQIWQVFMALNTDDKSYKKETLIGFMGYDKDREKLDKALAVRIGKFKKIIANETDSNCKGNLLYLNKRLSLAMFETLEKKRKILVITNYIHSCVKHEEHLKIVDKINKT